MFNTLRGLAALLFLSFALTAQSPPIVDPNPTHVIFPGFNIDWWQGVRQPGDLTPGSLSTPGSQWLVAYPNVGMTQQRLLSAAIDPTGTPAAYGDYPGFFFFLDVANSSAPWTAFGSATQFSWLLLNQATASMSYVPTVNGATIGVAGFPFDVLQVMLPLPGPINTLWDAQVMRFDQTTSSFVFSPKLTFLFLF